MWILINYLVNQYNITYYRTIKIKLSDGRSSICIDFDIENNDRNHKFKINDHVKILKHTTSFSQICLKTFL